MCDLFNILYNSNFAKTVDI